MKPLNRWKKLLYKAIIIPNEWYAHLRNEKAKIQTYKQVKLAKPFFQ
ncbi:hypothetical protein DB44_GO00070 [Candidatus Protochlamydia amoebophila]|uniref:Uncharacterized protein n=1 Tax=Candidatus Protochlamydia amoebophila TaxID=362787 RepID=A0A0C1JTY0_9BACT|nr:hypothetical protein DB44_GO00070 [Candidatus Protochlamydia amoebophila]